MTIDYNKDFLSKIQSSYLWNTDEEQANHVEDIPTQDLNICDGLLAATSPRFNSILERSQVISPTNVPKKEGTAISLSEMRLKSPETAGSRIAWTSNTSTQGNSEMPLLKSSSQFSRFAFLSKNGTAICQVRMITILFGSLILALCAIAIGIPIGLAMQSPSATTISTTATTPDTTSTTSTSTSTSSTSTTSTSTSSTSTSSTSTTSTSTTSTTSTTTTPPPTPWIPINYYTSCSSACINVSTVTPSTLIASWTFEGNTNDVSGNGENGEIVDSAAFTTGYIGQAILLQKSSSQYVNVPYISLVTQSFTVEAWIYLYSLSPTVDLGILGECEIRLIDQCLHYILRQNKMYMGFFSDDLYGTTTLTTSVWYHVAYVYDYSLNMKYVYLNGLLDGATTSTGPFMGASGNVTIGAWGSTTEGYWDGLLDQVTITNRAKTSCEILNDASLVAHFPFDNNANDIGPNSMSGTYNPQSNNGLSWISGRVNQALNFNSSNSYFQSCGFYALGMNQPYTIAMWVNPSFQSGTLFHISSAGTGSGGWCLPMIGFSSNGSLVVQTWLGSFTVSILGPILPTNNWTHIVQTYSSTNGLRLYINGGLYNSATANIFASSGVVMCVLLGSSGLGRNCQTGSISMGQYSGGIDEFYVYNRELTSTEICSLAHP